MTFLHKRSKKEVKVMTDDFRKLKGAMITLLIILCFLSGWDSAKGTYKTMPGPDGGYIVSSPDRNIEVSLFVNESGRLSYELIRKGRALIEESPLGIIVDQKDMGLGSALPESVLISEIDETSPVRGAHSVARDHCNTATLGLVHEGSGREWKLEVRVYNDGMAFRYVAPGSGAIKVSGEATGFVIPENSDVFANTNTINYEGLYPKKSVGKLKGIVGTPVTVVLPDEAGNLLIAEASLYKYSGMSLKARGDRLLGAVFEDDKSWKVDTGPGDPLVSPWRVIMAVTTLNDLVNCDIIHNVSPAPDPELFADSDEWIIPGRALWSWWSEFVGGTDQQKTYVDGASELGFEYVLVDAGWEMWNRQGKQKWYSTIAEGVLATSGVEIWNDKEEDHWNVLADLVDYAGSKGVKIWVWKHWKKLDDEKYRRWFFGKLRETGVVGVKIDFLDSESKDRLDFYESALQDAARKKLMVNFHGANKPAGEARTYPNEMTREGIRGLERNKMKGIFTLTPTYNVTLPFTRFVIGHGDYTPVTFSPKMLGETSFAHQLATAIVFFSSVICYADSPDVYLDNPDTAPALEVFKAIPPVWDETIVLPGCEIGECAAFARRSGDTWFIGAINGDASKTLNVQLSFLGSGNYKTITLADNIDEQAAFVRNDRTLKAGDELTATMRRGGGFVAMLVPSG